MAKGSSFWSTSRGKLGNMVVSIVRGQQVERAYQPKVLNPKTKRQMKQRASFASYVKLYKLLNSGLFKFAYEDKGKRESDYNAFMRHSLKYGFAANRKPTKRTDIWPLECNCPVLSYGSLGDLNSPEHFHFDSASENTGLCLSVSVSSPETITFGAFSWQMINIFGLQNGDFVTMFAVLTDIPKDQTKLIKLYASADATLLKPTYSTTQIIRQFQLDTDSQEKAIEVLENHGLTFGGDSDSELCYKISKTKLAEFCIYGTFFFSRKSEGQALKVTTSRLYPNVDEPNTIFTNAARLNQILTSWDASENAILEGSLLEEDEE